MPPCYDTCPVFTRLVQRGSLPAPECYTTIEDETGCDGCYACAIIRKCNESIRASNSKKQKIPDNRKRDPALEWAVTLTMPPGYATEQEMIKAITNIFNCASTNPPQPERADRWAYVLEYTEQGTPHIHGVYHTPSGRALSNKTIKRYWQIWNPKKTDKTRPPSGYHEVVRHSESYADYCAKEGVVIKSNT